MCGYLTHQSVSLLVVNEIPTESGKGSIFSATLLPKACSIVAGLWKITA